MKKPSSYCLIALVVLASWNQFMAAAFSDPGGEGYFRYLVPDASSGDVDNLGDGNDDPRDEDDSSIPSFVPHFHTIGFPKIATDPYVEKDYFNTSYNILADAKDVRREVIPDEMADHDDDDPNICMVVESKSGAQLWGFLGTSGSIFSGAFPHFLGKSRNQICIISSKRMSFWDPEQARTAGHLFGDVTCVFDYNGDAVNFLRNDEHSKNQGGITAMDSTSIIPGKGVVIKGPGFIIPETREAYNLFNFRCQNLAFNQNSDPSTAVAQLSGFADKEVYCYDSLKDYESWSKELFEGSEWPDERRKKLDKDDLRFSDQFFGVDTNKFSRGDDHAQIIGQVVETEIKTNEYTGDIFVWALIRTTKDMEVDVVFRKSLLDFVGSPIPRVGGVVRGHFWLSGVIMLDGDNEYM